MTIHLRQICLVTGKLAPVQADLEAVLSLKPAFHDAAVGVFGLENVLLPVGTQFLEVVAPVREDTAAGRYLARRGGDGGYMVICQVATRAEQAAARARAAERAVRVAWEANRETWTILQLHPRDMGATFFEIDWDARAEMDGTWMPAGGTAWRDAVASDVVDRITGVELQGPDPDRLAALWGHIADSPVVMDGRVPTVALANATLRFVKDNDGRGPGLGGIELRATDPGRLAAQAEARGCRAPDGTITVCGTRLTVKN